MREYVEQGDNETVLFREFEKHSWKLIEILQVFLSNVFEFSVFKSFSLGKFVSGVCPRGGGQSRGRQAEALRPTVLEAVCPARQRVWNLPHLRPAVRVDAGLVVRNQVLLFPPRNIKKYIQKCFFIQDRSETRSIWRNQRWAEGQQVHGPENLSAREGQVHVLQVRTLFPSSDLPLNKWFFSPPPEARATTPTLSSWTCPGCATGWRATSPSGTPPPPRSPARRGPAPGTRGTTSRSVWTSSTPNSEFSFFLGSAVFSFYDNTNLFFCSNFFNSNGYSFLWPTPPFLLKIP